VARARFVAARRRNPWLAQEGSGTPSRSAIRPWLVQMSTVGARAGWCCHGGKGQHVTAPARSRQPPHRRDGLHTAHVTHACANHAHARPRRTAWDPKALSSPTPSPLRSCRGPFAIASTRAPPCADQHGPEARMDSFTPQRSPEHRRSSGSHNTAAVLWFKCRRAIRGRSGRASRMASSSSMLAAPST